MPHVPTSTEPPTEERWAALGSVLLATLYLWILGWLVAAVLVPTLGLGWQPVVITSGSMQPLIRPGDIVVAGQVPDEPVGAGTVITFEDPARPGTLTTHRVVSLTPDGRYRTRGDANLSADSTPVPPEAVVGVGRLLVPMIGLPLLWLSGGILLFVIWMGVTLAAVAVAVRGGTEDEDAASGPPAPARRSRRTARPPVSLPRPGLGQAIRRLRPRHLQRQLVAAVVRTTGPWLRRVLPAARPAAGRVRTWLPLTTVLGAASVGARTPVTIALAALVAGVVAVADPRGPELRVGRWKRTTVHTAHVVAAALPSMALGRGMLALVGIGLLATTSIGRSAAAFSAASSNTGNSFQAAASFAPPPPVCPGPGSAVVVATADTYVREGKPGDNFATAKEMIVQSRVTDNHRAYLTFSLPAMPAGCSVTSASLQVYTTTSKQGRIYEAVRADTAFDPATVTWANQPTATGPVSTAVSGANGPTVFDATSAVNGLYTLGNTGVVLRDSVEDDGGTSTNKFASLEGTTDPTRWPTLTVSWG